MLIYHPFALLSRDIANPPGKNVNVQRLRPEKAICLGQQCKDIVMCIYRARLKGGPQVA